MAKMLKYNLRVLAQVQVDNLGEVSHLIEAFDTFIKKNYQNAVIEVAFQEIPEEIRRQADGSRVVVPMVAPKGKG